MLTKIVLLLLFFETVAAPKGPPPEIYMCNLQEPTNCQNNLNIKILKTSDTYQLTLYLNDQHNENLTFTFRCCAICEACETLLTSGKTTNMWLQLLQNCGCIQCFIMVGCDQMDKQLQCEMKVDTFLNKYCASTALLGANLSTISIVHTPPTIIPTQTSPALMPISADIYTCKSWSESQLEANSTTVVMALGIILGLCMVLLLVVTAGWVCTCRALKNLKQRPVKNILEWQR